jgi:hypothetical protein
MDEGVENKIEKKKTKQNKGIELRRWRWFTNVEENYNKEKSNAFNIKDIKEDDENKKWKG